MLILFSSLRSVKFTADVCLPGQIPLSQTGNNLHHVFDGLADRAGDQKRCHGYKETRGCRCFLDCTKGLHHGFFFGPHGDKAKISPDSVQSYSAL
jgi:hypothetical protein